MILRRCHGAEEALSSPARLGRMRNFFARHVRDRPLWRWLFLLMMCHVGDRGVAWRETTDGPRGIRTAVRRASACGGRGLTRRAISGHGR